MLDLTSPGFWVALVLGLAAGAAIGAGVAALVRGRSGAAGAAQLKEELDAYRGEVDEHFERTSDLFRDLTEKYRDLYEHLATGAGELCSDDLKGRQLQGSVRELLAADEPGAPPEDAAAKPVAADAGPDAAAGDAVDAPPHKPSTAA